MSATNCEFLLPVKINTTMFENYVNMITSALILYEHLITISQEIEVIWKRSRSLPTALFLLNRYNTLFNASIVILMGLHNTTNGTTLMIMNILLNASSILAYCLIAVFTALRVYALWSNNSRLFIMILIPSLAPAVTSLICLILLTTQRTIVPAFGKSTAICVVRRTMSPKVHTRRESPCNSYITFIYGQDAMGLSLTWVKTLSQFRNTRQLCMKTSVNDLFLRDGTMYFLILLVLHVSQLVVAGSYCLTHLEYVLSSVLVSRFLLNLRRTTVKPTSQLTSRRLSTIHFADIQGTWLNLLCSLAMLKKKIRLLILGLQMRKSRATMIRRFSGRWTCLKHSLDRR